jgi:hypothetical protein
LGGEPLALPLARFTDSFIDSFDDSIEEMEAPFPRQVVCNPFPRQARKPSATISRYG